jgi:hypothetical protein
MKKSEVVDPGVAPREQVAQALAGYLSEEQLERLLNSALTIEKQAWGTCRNCNTRVQVSVSDARAVISSVAELLNQGYGRPSDRQQESQVIVHRTVEYVCGLGHVCPECPPPKTERLA